MLEQREEISAMQPSLRHWWMFQVNQVKSTDKQLTKHILNTCKKKQLPK